MSSYSYEKSFDIRRKIEPARTYLWRVELPDLSIMNTGYVSESMNKAKDLYDGLIPPFDMEKFNTKITEVNTPYWTIDSDKVIDGASFWYTARHNDISNVSIVIDEDQYGNTLDYFDIWKALMVNDNGTYNPPAFWKKTIKVYRLNLLKLDFQVLEYNGYFPTELSNINNGYESDGALQYSVSFTGDTQTRGEINLEEFMSEEQKQTAVLLGSKPATDITDISISPSQYLELGITVANELGFTNKI